MVPSFPNQLIIVLVELVLENTPFQKEYSSIPYSILYYLNYSGIDY